LERHLETAFTPGQHVCLIGKNGSGKTHIALALAEIRTHVMIIATKRRDPLLQNAARGYSVVGSVREVPRTENGHPVYRRVIVWPGQGIQDEDARRKLQAGEVKLALNTAERQGKWTVLLDETMWAYDMLGLRRDLDSVWYQGRSSGLSLVANAQRPTRVPRLMISSASHLFLSYVSDKRDLEPLREIAGVVPPEVIEATLPTLDWDRHEFLYVGADTGYIARTIAPAKV
jgi:energy-coupling factor transporter ATP-binding protein EcfA2